MIAEINNAEMEKSAIMFRANVKQDVGVSICQVLGVSLSLDHDRYLELPLFVGRNKKQIFSFVRDRL
ncbi:hypothetical protein PVK06_046461 [Gossypium arboreum]|uniref:Uncharacterized protein n=1 Tax=Gossypium arboreum TaxID=29729 RepID=A0ABR0MAK4_GOSAR|nr:hypothetical protein PVK06_046461 [Gossypium arboreum]